jgi:hypothetical protein
MDLTREQVLPSIPLPEKEIEIGGQTITLRSLSRAEVLQLKKFEANPDEAENFILAKGTGITEEAAAKWRSEVDASTAGKVVDGIIFLSGLAVDSKA